MTQEIGSGGFSKQSATGAVLNLAARLQAEAAPGTVIASRETIDRLGSQFEYLPLDPRPLKGISRTVELFRVLRPLPAVTRSGNPLLRGVTSMVGRDAALARVLERWKLVRQQRRCATVAVVGDAGIGKTRLVLELVSGPEFGNSSIIQTPCHEIFASTPLYPVGSFLWGRAGLTVQDDEATKVRKISQLLDELALNSPENQEIVASLLGLATGSIIRETAPTPTLVKRKQYDFVISALRRSTSALPVILWVDDAHWLDPSSAELLGEAIVKLADAPVLILLTMRSFPRAPFLPEPDEVVSLTQLDEADARRLVRSIHGAEGLPEDTVAQVIMGAEGVPLFLEQIVISVLDEQSRAPVMPSRPRMVPSMLAEMLSERLDRRPGSKRIVQAAACIGRSFTPAFLGGVLQQPADDLQVPLESLIEAEILLPRRYGVEIRYDFRHILLQRMAYESVVQTDRRIMHGRIVEMLRRDDGAALVPPEILAHHLSEAAQYIEAIGEWTRAGAAAAQRSAHVEAIEHIRKGLALLERVADQETRDQLEMTLQAALIGPIISREGATSVRLSECCQRGLELSERRPPSRLILAFVFGQFTFSNCRGHLLEANKLARLFLSLSERASSESGRVIGHRLLGTVLFGQGYLAEARRQFETSLELYEHERDGAMTHMFGQNTEVHTKSSLSLALLCLGDLDRSLSIGIDALRSADVLRHPHSTAIPLTYVGGWVFGLCGAATHMIREARRLIALADQHQLTAFRAHGNAAHGWALCQQGDFHAGISAMEAAISVLDSIGFKLGLAGYLGNLADALRRLGNVKAARAACERAMETMHESSFCWFEPELRRIEALIVGQEQPQRPAAAEEMLREAVACAQGSGFPIFEYRCLASLRETLKPGDLDFELETRMRSLARFENAAERIDSLMTQVA
jgi:predicted ATPase